MSPRRRGNLWARITALETGTGLDEMRFRLDDGTTVRLPVLAVLDVIAGFASFGAGPHGPVMLRVVGTPEPSGLARGLVAEAAAHRGEAA